MSQTNTRAHTERAAFRFESSLDQGWERFLAHAIEHGLRVGRRRPEDFLRHFPPRDIMAGLRDAPELRASILERTTGIKGSIALHKTATSCGIDLEIAVREHETDAETIVELLDPDDIVRHLDRDRLWSYVAEGEFWNTRVDDTKALEIAKAHLSFLLERALAEGLVTGRDIIEGLTADRLAHCLPRTELASVLVRALEEGHIQRAFTEEHLLAIVPPARLVESVPLAHVWNEVIVPKIARAHGLDRGDRPVATPHVARPRAAAIASELEEVHVTELVVDDPDDDDSDFSVIVNPLPVSAPVPAPAPAKVASTRAPREKSDKRRARSKRDATAVLTSEQLGN